MPFREKNVLLQTNCNKKTAMSEKEIDQYRLTDLEEPTDEMLAFIMHEVAEEARRTNEEALDRYFNEINEIYQQKYGKGYCSVR